MNNREQDDSYSYGLALLKIISSICIIRIHYGRNGTHGILERILFPNPGLAVPLFMAMAFVFTNPYFLAFDLKKLGRRLLSICIPMWFWGIAYWLLYRVVNYFFKADLRDSWSVLAFQLTLGSDINPVYWFNFDLLVITLILIAVYRATKNPGKADIISLILAFLCIAIDGLGLDHVWFESVRYEIMNPAVRFFQMIPYAVLGMFIGRWRKNGDCPNSYKLIFAGISFALLYFVNLPAPLYTSYLNSESLLLTTLLVVLLDKIQLGRLLDSRLKWIIHRLADRTLGVYGLHIAVGKVVCAVIDKAGLKIDSALICILIFAICVIIGEAMIKIFGDRCKMVV